MNDEIECASPVFPTVPLAINDTEELFLSAPTGGVAAVVPTDRAPVHGKLLVNKGMLLPGGFTPALSPAYAPSFLGDGSWLVCRRLVKGSASKDISLINIREGTVFTKKGLLYDYIAATPSGNMVLLGMQSIATTSPKQIMSLLGSKYTVIYNRPDGKLYPSISEYVPVVAWSDECIGTIAPDGKSFEVVEKKGERWQLSKTVTADTQLNDVSWGKKRALAVAVAATTVQFYDLAQGVKAGKITCQNLSSQRTFMRNDALLVCGVDSVHPSVVIIGCADLKNPQTLISVLLGEAPCDIGLDNKITHLIQFRDHVLVKTTAKKSYAVGPVSRGVVKKYLDEQEKAES